MQMDPYYEWLGIPREEQPPNHYRLLGISLWESNPQVIDSAANQRMGYLQELTGDHEQLDNAQRIIGEISRARLVLLDATKKDGYDKEIRKQLDSLAAPSTTPSRLNAINSTETTRKHKKEKTINGLPQSASTKQQPRTAQPQSRNLPTKKNQTQTDTDEKRFLSRPRLLISLAACSLILSTIAVFVLIAGPDNNPEPGTPSGEPSAKNAAKPNNQTVKIVKNQPKTGENTNVARPRPVPSLFRSPEELAAGPSPADPISTSGQQNGPNASEDSEEGDDTPDANPFIIGSKRDNSNTSTPLPSTSLPITGDIEDRVRVNVNDNEAQFTFDDEGKREQISLVGSFNSWDSTATPMQREGTVWKITKRLSPIHHEFKFVDGNGKWYPDGDNLALNLKRQSVSADDSNSNGENHAEVTNVPIPIQVFGDQEGRVVITQVGDSVRFAFRNEPPQDYVLLLGDFNSWNSTVGAMQRDGENWVTTKQLTPGNYAFKFLGPDDNWYPPGENLSIHFQPIVTPVTPEPNVAENPENSAGPPAPDPSFQSTQPQNDAPANLSIQRAREYLSDAGLYEGKPGVWYFPQSNRLVIRQYGRIAKDPKIKKALKKLGDRLPHPAEMENPPPRRR